MDVFGPLIVLVFGWGFALKIPGLKELVPKMPEAVLPFVGIYVAARLVRIFEVEKHLKTWWLIAALPILLALQAVGFNGGYSPVTFGLTGALLILFSRIALSDWAGKIVAFVSPSVFAIYLIHTNEVGGVIIQAMEKSLVVSHQWLVPCAWVVVAVCLFVGSFVLDLPRRTLVKIFSRVEV